MLMQSTEVRVDAGSRTAAGCLECGSGHDRTVCRLSVVKLSVPVLASGSTPLAARGVLIGSR